MFDPQEKWLQHVYVIMAALAGSVTALAFMQWKKLTAAEIALTLFVGASFAIFVTPWVAHEFFGLESANVRTIAGLSYVTASGSNTLIPMMIRWFSRASGIEEKKS